MNFSVNEFIKPKGFDPIEDKIAIVIREFELKKNPDWPFRYSEPYIISLVIDQNGTAGPTIDFNILPFPKVAKGDINNFGGQGHLIYGPANPGEFLAYSILYMESDSDMRELGKTIEKIIKSEALKKGLNSILVANPGFGIVSEVLMELTGVLSERLKKNKDDELFRQNGTLLRDIDPAYNNNEVFENQNSFIRSKLYVVPLNKRLESEKETETIIL